MVKGIIWDIKSRPLSSFLSLLGFVVGVFSVVFMGALGVLEERKMLRELDKAGADRIVIYPKDVREYPFRPNFSGKEKTLKPSDAFVIKDRLEEAKYVAPCVYASGNVRRKNCTARTTVLGTTRDYLKIMDFSVKKGKPFHGKELLSVCLIGHTVYRELFEKGDDPVGKSITINGVPYRISGLLSKKGVDASGQDQDDIVMVPVVNALHILLHRDWVSLIYVTPRNPEKLQALIQDIKTLLGRKHGKSDFKVDAMVEFVEKKVKLSKIARKSTLATSFVALLVGGVGIMSLMLIKAKDRIREIGIKRAVGATKKDIFVEFFAESLLLSVMGSLAGFALGLIGTAALVSRSTAILLPSLRMGVVSLILSIVIGTLFGVYPAIKASRTNVVEAVTKE